MNTSLASTTRRSMLGLAANPSSFFTALPPRPSTSRILRKTAYAFANDGVTVPSEAVNTIGDLERNIRALADRFAHVRIPANPQLHEPDSGDVANDGRIGYGDVPSSRSLA